MKQDAKTEEYRYAWEKMMSRKQMDERCQIFCIGMDYGYCKRCLAWRKYDEQYKNQ